MKRISFTIPTEPLSQPRPRLVNGHFLSNDKRTLAYKNLVKSIASEVFNEMLEGEICAKIKFYRATKRRIDLDNLLKPILDSLNGIAYKDDSQVTEIIALKYVDKSNPRAEVTIYTY